jgi:type IV pilus assembly protein PilC
MSKKEQLQFIHSCAILLEAGISLSEALEMVSQRSKVARDRKVLAELQTSVTSGLSFSRSITKAGMRLDPVIVTMIKAGESSGILPIALRQAILITEKTSAIKKKLIGALIYPAFIAIATCGMTLFLVLYIFPKIVPLFASMNITLPFLTRAVMSLYQLLSHYGLWLLGFVVVSLLLSAFLYIKHQGTRRRLQWLFLRAPFLGIHLQKYCVAEKCRAIGILIESGQNLPNILDEIGGTSGPEPYREIWNEGRREVVRGSPLSSVLSRHPALFPRIVADLVLIGERTGSLGAMFNHICRLFDEELDEVVKHVSTSIEPVLMIAMGLIVGSVALSIILPIYEITNHLT